jgi:23S rRNA pseudouridine2605 synthase
MRLNRFLAAAGLGSRRSCEELILKGSVSVNGTYVRDLATRVREDDDVRVHGRTVHAIASRSILLNKPAGYTTTRGDRHAERTIFDLLPSDCGHLFHVGRLDRESEGLLLLTNDGAMAQELMHPSKGIEKEYEVVVDRPFTSKDAAALKRGTWVEGSVARVESVKTLGPTKIAVILHQGLKRQIRVMLGQLGFKVQRLVRVRLGPLTLRGIKPGSYRDLRPEDLASLRRAVSAPKAKRPMGPALPKSLKFTNFTVVPASSKRLPEAVAAPKKTRKTSPTGERLKRSKGANR